MSIEFLQNSVQPMKHNSCDDVRFRWQSRLHCGHRLCGVQRNQTVSQTQNEYKNGPRPTDSATRRQCNGSEEEIETAIFVVSSADSDRFDRRRGNFVLREVAGAAVFSGDRRNAHPNVQSGSVEIHSRIGQHVAAHARFLHHRYRR